MTVGQVCSNAFQNCTCTMGAGRGGGDAWQCTAVGRDGGGMGGMGGRNGGRDGGGNG
jgi:hypothetical protein